MTNNDTICHTIMFKNFFVYRAILTVLVRMYAL